MKYEVLHSVDFNHYYLTYRSGPILLRFVPKDNKWTEFSSYLYDWSKVLKTDSLPEAIAFIIEGYTQSGDHDIARKWVETI